MFVKAYNVDLLSDISITADAVTESGHSSLDYLPGSLFLGASSSAALRVGGQFREDVFLSARVIFSNAYPVCSGCRCLPVPLCFNRIKGEGWENVAPYNSLSAIKPAGQPKQWRDGYISPNGSVVSIALHSNMKTAIDRKTRRSMDEQLFDTQSIPAGNRYRFVVLAVSAEDSQYIEKLLTASGPVRLGRSRSAEYGSVVISPLDEKVEQPAPVAFDGGEVCFYLASDMLIEEKGGYSLRPAGEVFGLEGAEIVPSKTFLRSRRVSPYNSYFNTRMKEREVLTKGSVVTFKLQKPLSQDELAALQQKLAAGVGVFREEGFGEVLVNPGWLVHSEALSLKKADPENVCERSSASASDSTLVSYVKQKKQVGDVSYDAFEAGRNLCREWEQFGKNKKMPRKSQWGTIREMAVKSLSGEGTLMAELAKYCCETLRRKDWEDLWPRFSFSIEDMIKTHGYDYACLTLFYVASEMRKASDKTKERRGR